jgi:hypothetical protein
VSSRFAAGGVFPGLCLPLRRPDFSADGLSARRHGGGGESHQGDPGPGEQERESNGPCVPGLERRGPRRTDRGNGQHVRLWIRAWRRGSALSLKNFVGWVRDHAMQRHPIPGEGREGHPLVEPLRETRKALVRLAPGA